MIAPDVTDDTLYWNSYLPSREHGSISGTAIAAAAAIVSVSPAVVGTISLHALPASAGTKSFRLLK